MSNVIEVHDSLSQWVNHSEKRLVVIDFFATWCGPCKMMHPIFDQLSTKYPNVVFLRVDGDKNRHISGEYGISGFPTFVFVFHGDEVDRVVGANPSDLENKIVSYSQSAQTFKGTGMALGGTSVTTPETAREMRLKKFNNVKMTGTETTAKVAKMFNKLSKDASDSDESEIPIQKNSSEDASIRDTLLGMGFSSLNVDKTLRDCKSRDLADLVAFITSLPETNASEEHEVPKPRVVCDGDQCRLVTDAPPKKSFDERLAEAKEVIKQKKVEKELKEKEEERLRELARINQGKEMQERREELERIQRQRELEKEKREKKEAAEEKKRQLALWRKEHGLPDEVKEVKEKSPEEKVQLLAESVALQRIDNVGPVALKTMVAMLNNCAKPDPKYRQVKKENAVLKKRVLSVPGALPLLMNAGFEDAGEMYIMKEYNEEKVNLVLNAIQKCL